MTRTQSAIESQRHAAGPMASPPRRATGRAAAPFKRRLLVETLEQRVLMDADPLAVATVNGSISSPGEVDSYTFTLENPTKLALDSLVENSNLRWTLSGPSGTVVSPNALRAQGGTNSGYAPLSLVPGDYRLDVDGTGATTGDYGFRLLDLSRATAVAIDGTAIAGSMAATAQQEAFAFDAQAGDLLWLGITSLPSGVVLRLYDPFGNLVDSSLTSSQEVGRLPYNGQYTLLLDAGTGTPAGAAYDFSLRRMASPLTDLGAVGATASLQGSLANAGDSAVFRFTLSESRRVLFDSRTASNNFAMTLTGPAGVVASASGSALSGTGLIDLDDYNNPWGALSLPPGAYTVSIDGAGATSGAFSVQMLDASAPTVVGRGALVTGQLDPGSTVQLYSLAATAGDGIRFDAISATASGGGTVSSDVDWSLYDPYGRLVAQASTFIDSANLSLARTGHYLLVVTGSNARTASSNYSFQIVDNGNTPPTPLPDGTDLALGAMQAGALPVAASSQTWRFTLTEPKTLYFDPTTGSPDYGTWVNLFAKLEGPRGVESDTRFGGYSNAYSYDGAQVWTLPAGDYALTIRSAVAVPEYRFRMLDLAASAAPLATGSRVQGQLDPGSGVAVYAFDAAAGERVYFEALQTVDSRARVRVLDPWGRQLNSDAGVSNWELTLPYEGRYTLLVEGNNLVAAPISYAFALHRVTDKLLAYDPAAIALTPVRWTADGAQAALRLDGSQVATVAADPALSIAGDLSFQVRFKVDALEQDWQSVLYKGNNVDDDNQRNYSLWISRSGYVHLAVADQWGEQVLNTPSGTIQPDTWYDVVGVVDRSTGKLQIYLDGVKAAESSGLRTTLSGAQNRTYDTPLTIGNAREQWFNGVSQFEGEISELRLWAKALSAAEVAAGGTDDTTLRLWLRLDEGAGSVLADSSGAGRSATVHNLYEGLPGVVVGTVDVPGQQVAYQFSLPTARRVYLDGLTWGSDFRINLSGPNTALLNEDLSWFDNSHDALDLPAGDYRLTVDATNQATGAFAFRLLDISTAATLPFDMPVDVTLDPGDGARLFQFDAMTGQVAYLDLLSTLGSGSARWRLLDPFGRAVFASTGVADRDSFTLGYSGRYTLIFDGYPYERERRETVSFVLRNVTPTAPVTFDIAAGVDAGVQRTAGRGSGAVAVNDPQHVEIGGAATDLAGSSTVEAWFKIEQPTSGQWIPLFVKSNAAVQRQYGLWINANGSLYAEASDSYDRGTAIQSAADLVAPDAWHHVALVLDRANARMSIVLDGAEVASGYLYPDPSLVLPEPLRLGRSAEGHADHEGHDLSIDELRIWSAALSLPAVQAGMAATLTGREVDLAALYRFDEAAGEGLTDAVTGSTLGRVVRLASEAPGLVTGRLEQVGQTRRYGFTLDTERRLYLDNFTHRSDLTWRLSGPTVDIGGGFQGADSNNSYHLLRLPAGTYTVTVDANGTATGYYAFRFLDAAGARLITRDTRIDTRLVPGAEAQIFQFDASAGDRVYLDALAYEGQAPVWRLLDPTGAQVLGINAMNTAVDVTTLPRSGRYTLIVEDYTASGQPGPDRDVSFMVRTVADVARNLTLGSSLRWALEWTAGPGALAPAVRLDGTNEIVVDADARHDLTGDFTVETLVRLDAYGSGWTPLVSRATHVQNQTFGLWVGTAGQIYLDSNAAGSAWNLASANGALRAGEWHRVSASVDRTSGAVAIYVDGAVVASRTLAGHERAAASSQPGAPLRVGQSDLTDSRYPLQGAVADLRVWGVARTAADIAAATGGDLVGSETGLVLNLQLREGAGADLADSSPSGLAGRIASVNQPLGPTLVEDAISAVGQRVVYSLTPTTDTKLLFDALTNRGDLQWSLLSPGGAAMVDQYGTTLSNRAFNSSDRYNVSYFALRAGQTYRLVVDGTNDTMGKFAFRLLDLRDATLIEGPATNQGFQYASTVRAYSSQYGSSNWSAAQVLFEPDTFTYGDHVTAWAPSSAQSGRVEDIAGLGTVTGWEFVEVGFAEPASATGLVIRETWGSGAVARVELVYEGDPAGTRHVVWQRGVDGDDTSPFGQIADFQIDFGAATPPVIGARVYVDTLATLQWEELDAIKLITTGGSAGSGTTGYGIPTTWTTRQPASTALYAFDGKAGDQILLDRISYTDTRPVWRLFDPTGRELFSSDFYYDSQVLTLHLDGRYTVALEGWVGEQGLHSQTFQVRKIGTTTPPSLPAGAALGFVDGVAELAGTTAVTGEADAKVFRFTLAEPRRVYVDTLNAAYPAYYAVWSLNNLGGQVSQRWAYDTDAANQRSYYELPAGDYAFKVWVPAGYEWALANFAFRLIDIDTVLQPMGIGTAVHGALAPANTAAFYSFSGDAGERFYLHATETTNMGSAYWRVLDARSLETVAQNYFTNNLDGLVLPRTGPYILTLEGSYGNAASSASYTFTAYRNTDASEALVLGSTASGSIAQPGDTRRYRFDVAATDRFWFDSFTARSDIRWRVLDAAGATVVADRNLADDVNDYGPFRLDPGSYTLVVDGNGASTGAFSFRLLALSSAVATTPGTATAGQLTPGNETDLYRFEAGAGDRFFFDMVSRSGGPSLYWRLYDPHGQRVFAATDLQDVDVVALPYAGRYTLVIEGQVSNTSSATYSFNVVPVLAQPPVQLSIGLQPAPNLQVQGLGVVGAGGDGSIYSGGTVNVSWSTVNIGDRDTAGSFQERVIVSNALGQTVVNQLVPYDAGSAGNILAGAGVARQATVLLPPGAAGAGLLTIRVVTDAGNAILEKGTAGEADNTAETTVTSSLLLYPDLRVSSVAVSPSSGLAAGDQVSIGWQVFNQGERAPSVAWSDRILLRNRSTGVALVDRLVAVDLGDAALAPGASLARQFVFNWPAGVNGAGDFEVIVTADATGLVPEYNADDTAEGNNSASASFVSAPDLAVQDLQVLTATPVSGGEVQLSWQVHNQGNAPTPAGWFDRIVVTNLDTGSTLLNLDVAYTPDAAIAVGTSASRSFTLRLPEGAASVGLLRFAVTADQNAAGASSIPETQEGNNSASVERAALLRVAPNLVVSSFTAPTELRSGDTAPFSWTVRNAGNADTGVTVWHDRIVMSADTTIGNGDDVTVGTLQHSGALGIDGSYDVSWSPTVPGGYDGSYQFALMTDVFNSVVEPDGEGDNRSLLRASLLTAYHADLLPQVLSLPAAAIGGSSVDVAWRVTNQGDATTNSSWWVDRLWLSPDGSLGAGSGAILLGDFGRSGTLAAGASYDRSQAVTLPNGVTGSYKLVVQTDVHGWVFESRFDGNNTAVSSGTIVLDEAPAVDLRVENVGGPAVAQPGQRQTLGWEIVNRGGGEARAPWTDQVWLSRDGTLDNAVYVTAYTHAAPLAGGGRAQVSVQFWMPDLGDGAWRAVVVTDALGQVYETGAADAETGNRAAGNVAEVQHPNLRATDLVLSGNPTAGQSATLTWTVRNDGSGPALPPWLERLYLSRDGSLDGADVLLAELARAPGLAAGAALPGSASFTLPAGASGSYRFLLVSDAGNAVRELGGEADNLAAIDTSVLPAPKPNLQVGEVSGPAQILPGREFSVGWTEFNRLATPATGDWSAQVFLSSDDNIGADLFIGSASLSGPLDGLAQAVRTASFVAPVTLSPGSYRVVVRTDAGNGVLEEVETDNAAIAAAASTVSPSLKLNLSTGTASENAGSVSATVVRNGDLSQPLTIALTTSDASEATVPATVTIAAGQASVSFAIGLVRDALVDGSQQVTIAVTAPSHQLDQATLAVQNSDTPALALSVVATVVEDQGQVLMTLSRNAGPDAPALDVRLTSANTSALVVPPNLSFAAGQTSLDFLASLVDNEEVWGGRSVGVVASAAGHVGGAVDVQIIDDDLPELTLELSAQQVAEGAGAGAVGVTLRRDRVGPFEMMVYLHSSDRNSLTAPTRVTFGAQESSIHFFVNPVDDSLVDGDKPVVLKATMTNPAGHSIGQNIATALLLVSDDDGPTLSVTLAAESVGELGAPVSGTVSRNTGTAGDLVVTLLSTDTGEATVPTTVTIPDGEDSVAFTLAPVADGVVDGSQAVTVRASAEGFNPGAASLNVTEGDLPDLTVTSVTLPAAGLAKTRVDVSWTVENVGRTAAAGGYRDRVYLSLNPALDTADLLVGSVLHTALVAAGASYSQGASIQLPETTGQYHLIIVTDTFNAVEEGSERNNLGVSVVPITVSAPLVATVSTPVEQLPTGHVANAVVVPLSGTLTDVVSGQPVPNTAVKVMVRANGIDRFAETISDADGHFAIDYQPLPGETGLFEVGAGYVGTGSFAVQDSFKLIGMRPSASVLRLLGTNETALEGSFTLQNLTDVPLSGLSASIEGLAANFDFFTAQEPAIGGNGQITVYYKLVGHGVTDALQASRGWLVIGSQEGAVARVALDTAVIPQMPKLVATPGYLAQGMLVGRQTLVSFDVINQGAADTGVVDVGLPDLPWMSLVSPAQIANLAAGETTTVTVALSPPADLELLRYDGTIAVNARLGGLSLPFQFRAVSQAVGDFRITVEDQLTYYAEGAPKVAGATVTVSDPYTYAVVASGVTGADGSFAAAGLAEGTYIVTVQADKHASYRATQQIKAGTLTDKTIFLDRQLVSYTWNVVPVDIEDRYKITLESTFETEVPLPVITTDPMMMPLVFPGQTSTVMLTVTNHGLIEANEVQIRGPNDDLFEVTVLTPTIDVLPAKSSVQVPIEIRLRPGVTPEQVRASAQLLDPSVDGDLDPEGWISAIGKCLGIDTAYKLECGADGRWYTVSTKLDPVFCGTDLGENAYGIIKDAMGPGGFNLLKLPCNILDAVLSCFTDNSCIAAVLNGLCGAIVGGIIGGPAGAAAGAAGAASDLLACLCSILPPLPSFNSTPTSGGDGGGGGWGWYVPGGVSGGGGIGINIQYVNCRGEPVSAQDQALADEGLLDAVAAGVVPQSALEALAAVADGSLQTEGAGICAQVRIRLEQEAVLTRTAFQGTLEIVNGNTGLPLSGISLNLDFRDEAGNPVNDLFAIRGPVLSGLTAVDGSGVIAAGSRGSAQYLFIPTVDAARDQPKNYKIGGTLSYIENGQKITVPLVDAAIVVYPEARLNLHYFQQRDVYGDDPFTEEVVEPSEPFALGLLAYNDGKGAARNFSITSAQPEIIENQKGLLIDFKIVGTQVGDQPVAPTLTANLGNIDAGKTQVAQWLLTSTLQGRFINYSATFEHVDGMGDTRLSLIESVNIHELIRSVRVGTGDAPDFLSNDDPDADHTPDRLYTDNGAQHIVMSAEGEAASSQARPGAMAVQLTATVGSGWSYFKLADPGVGYRLDRIVRDDGKLLAEGREAWRTDRSFPASDSGAVRERLLHFIDEAAGAGGEVGYTAYFKVDDAVAPRLLEIVPVSPDPRSEAVDHVDVRFSEAIDLATLGIADLTLTRDGGATNLVDGSVTVSALGGGLYRIGNLAALTAPDGYYQFAVDAGGVADYGGNAGLGLLVDSWGKGDVGPYVTSLVAGAAERNSALDAVEVGFNTALDIASLTSDDLRLTRDGVVVALSGLGFSALEGNRYRVEGLAAFTASDGAYTLTVIASGLQSATGKAGIDQASVGWRMDAQAPQVLDVVDLVDRVRNTVVMGLEVLFSEPIALGSFDYRDLSLTRTVGGSTSANLIDDRVTVTHQGGGSYLVAGFNWVTGLEGDYRFSVAGEGIADSAGNAGSGTASEAWTMDFSHPDAPTQLAIAPDGGVSATDGLTDTLSFTLTGQLGEPGLSVRVTDLTTDTELGYGTVTGNRFSLAVNLKSAGQHEIRVRAVDEGANPTDSTIVVFVDLVRPSLAPPVLVRDAGGNVDRITLDFSEAIDPASMALSVLGLSRNGQAQSLIGATLTRISATRFELGGLAALTSGAGRYRFIVDLTQVRDLAGNAGSEPVAALFDGALATSGRVSGLVFDDIDGNGTREADELLQGGWTVFADANANGTLDAGEVSAVTDALTGRYALEALALGSHRIVVLAPAGWAITPGPVAELTLSSDAPDLSANFGAFSLASLGGTVYDDANANGLREAGETGLAGRLVVLDVNGNGSADAGEASTTTDGEGRYRFDALAPGSVRVVLAAGDGWLPLLPASPFSPKSGESAARDLAAVRPATIGGLKYEDLNGNGLRDAGDPGVAGWLVFLDYNGNDALDAGERSTTTDATGNYAFDGLLPGSYRVVEAMRAGWVQTSPGTLGTTDGQEQGLDTLLTLPGMVADIEQDLLIDYLNSTGANYDCGCGSFVLDKYTTGQAAGQFSKLDTVTSPEITGLTGRGVRVAVIDTGIDTGSSFFGPDADGDGTADRIVYQHDFGDGDADASDLIGHGTHVAGVIAGDDARYAGIATDAELVVLKVFDVNRQGYFSTLKRALEWVDANAEAYGIGVVNLSLGDGGNWGEAISRYGMGELFERLAAKGLVTIAAAGNNYYQTGGALGVAYPGADPAVLSVGAMWAGNFGGPWRFSSGATDYTTAYGRIASFTQRDPDQVDVMAPGARFTSAGLNGALATMQGTSQAAAFMSGAAALVQQAARQLLGRMLTTGEFAALLDANTYRAVDGDDESDNVVNSGSAYNKLDIPKLLRGLQAYAAAGGGGGGAGGDDDGDPGSSPLAAYGARTLTVLSGQAVGDQDFGNFRLGQVSGFAFDDANRDGLQQADEAGLAGVTVFADVDGNGQPGGGDPTASTDADGRYSLTGLRAGLVSVRASTLPGYANTTPAVFVTNIGSGTALSQSFGYLSAAPQDFDAVADTAEVDEDGSVRVDVLANDDLSITDGLVLTISGSGPAHGMVTVEEGALRYAPTGDFNGVDSFIYSVSEPGGRFSSATVTVTVNPVNDAPTLVALPDRVDAEGATVTVQPAAFDIDGDTLRWSLLDAPLGATIDPYSGAIGWNAGDQAGQQLFRVQVSDGAGGLAEQSFRIEVQLGPLRVTAFEQHAWGFGLRFNDVVDASRFNLYGGNPDLVVTGARVGSVRGSVVFDADRRGLQWVRTGATLEPDRYTVTLRGADEALVNARRGALDGDGDGVPGGNYGATLDAATVPAVRLRLPDFARGPGQVVQVPHTAAGLPVTLVTDGSARSLGFRLLVDASVMTVSELRAGSGLPAGATVDVVAVAGGFDVTITSPEPIAAGSRQVLEVRGAIQASATLGSAGVLRLEQLVVDGVSKPTASDAAVLYVGYTGDIDGNGLYETADVTRLQRLVVRLDTWIPEADDIDATVIADVDADGAVTSRDAAFVLQRRVLAATPMIPALAPVLAAALAVTGPALSPLAAAGSAGPSQSPALKLNGSLANFRLSASVASAASASAASAAPAAGLVVSSASLPVSLKLTPSVLSQGVSA